MPTWLAGLKRPLKIGLGVAILTAILTLFMQNSYRSEARILPVDSKGAGGIGNLSAAAAAFGVNVPGGDSADANFVDILQSRTLRKNILQSELTFHARAWRFGAAQLHKQTLYDYLKTANMDRAVQALGGMLTVSRDLKSKVLTISVETQSPELSQQIVQRAVELLGSFILERGQTRGGYKAAFVEARLKESRLEMSKAEDEFRRFQEGNRNYLVSADPTVRLRGGRLDMELRLRQQLVLTLALSYEQALMEEKDDVPILNVLDPGNLPVEKSKPVRSTLVLAGVVLGAIFGLLWDKLIQVTRA